MEPAGKADYAWNKLFISRAVLYKHVIKKRNDCKFTICSITSRDRREERDLMRIIIKKMWFMHSAKNKNISWIIKIDFDC